MGETFTYPEVKILNRVVSSDYHCADAVLVKVEEGTEALAFESWGNGTAVTLNGESLFSVNEEKFCPTCGGYLYRGYGERNISMEEAMALGGRLNEPYAGIRTAVERMRPLLGLLRSGHYVVADYELFPFVENTHFWNYLDIPEVFTTWGYRIGVQGYATRVCPSYMIPSQRPATCNPERIDHYIRLPDTEAYPRAIGLYASGNMVLLLDGHHKAAASASQGRMVKCLVIMPAQLGEEAEETVGSGTLLYFEGGLMNDAGKLVGWVYPCLNRRLRENGDNWVRNDEQFAQWGSVPTKYVPDQSVYDHIPRQEMMEWIHFGKQDSYAIARDTFRNYYAEPKSKKNAWNWLRWHQAQFDALSGGTMTPWQMPLLERKQFSQLLRAARNFGIDRDPKTANAVYGVFSFLPGQRKVLDIPQVLERKVKNEAIKTVLIPNSVREVDTGVFENFPDLENIVLEKGNPKLRPEPFRAIANQAKEKRKGELHLKQYPFADLAELLKKKQEEER